MFLEVMLSGLNTLSEMALAAPVSSGIESLFIIDLFPLILMGVVGVMAFQVLFGRGGIF